MKPAGHPIRFEENEITFIARPETRRTLDAILQQTLTDGTAAELPMGKYKNMRSFRASAEYIASKYRAHVVVRSNGKTCLAWLEKRRTS